MLDLAPSLDLPTTDDILDEVTDISVADRIKVAIDEPARWFTALDETGQKQVEWVSVKGLREHPACDFHPR